MDKYVVIKDLLMDKNRTFRVYGKRSIGIHITWEYWLYFKDYYGQFGHKVRCNKYMYDKFLQGEEFYLVFKKAFGNLLVSDEPAIYEINSPKVTDIMKASIVENTELEKFSGMKKLVIKQDKKNRKINKWQVIKDIYTSTFDITKFFCIAIILLMVGFLALTELEYKDGIAYGFIILTVLLGELVIILPRIRKYMAILKIMMGNFYITKDIVKNVDCDLEYRYFHKNKTLYLTNYKEKLYGYRSLFLDTQVGDDIYLIFTGNDDNPIWFYSGKYATLEEKFIQKLK